MVASYRSVIESARGRGKKDRADNTKQHHSKVAARSGGEDGQKSPAGPVPGRPGAPIRIEDEP